LPFTLAHPAAVVPLRRVLVLSALVVGSMAPDFHYFLNLAPRGHFGHTVKGLFVFCLPVGLAVLWVFQTVIKQPLISLAPEIHQQKLVSLAGPFRWGPVPRFLLILFSLLIGAISHLAWDAFTHDRGLIVRNFPDLRSPVFEDFGTERPLYNLLQHGSSVAGLVLLAWWYWRWFKRTPPQSVPSDMRLPARTKAWIATTLATVAVGVSAAYAYGGSHHLRYLPFFLGIFAVTLMSTVFVEAVCFSLWWHWRRKRLSKRMEELVTYR
jgi:Domain of unknown function (DUF4184)